MTETSSQMTGGEAPARRRWSWWSILLVISLALNLFVGAAAVTRFFVPPKYERISGMSFLSILPRRFFGDLERARRDELMGHVKGHRERFREGQEFSRKAAAGLADALEASPYDEARVRAVLDEFNRNGAELVGLGSAAAMDFISHLTPEERTRLAQRIRDRAKGRRRD